MKELEPTERYSDMADEIRRVPGSITFIPMSDNSRGDGNDSVSFVGEMVVRNIERMRELHPCSQVRITYTVEAVD